MKLEADASGVGIGKGDCGDGKRCSDGPLDGGTSGTIGGGGAETGGSTQHPPPGDEAGRPDNAASGRRSADPVTTSVLPDELKPGATSVSRPRDRK
jgi:hypothetical protein